MSEPLKTYYDYTTKKGSRLVIIHCEDPLCAAELRARPRGCSY